MENKESCKFIECILYDKDDPEEVKLYIDVTKIGCVVSYSIYDNENKEHLTVAKVYMIFDFNCIITMKYSDLILLIDKKLKEIKDN